MQKVTILSLLIALTVLPQVGQSQQKNTTKPNIVYILADDLGYGELGAYGQTKIETPNIDALARNGKKFTQHYAFPVCAPSRYLLMTGINSGHAYIRGNHEWGTRGPVHDFKAMEENPFLEGQFPIPDSTITIAEIFKQAGYATALVGKWGLGAPFTSGLPNRQGLDYFYGYICQRQDHTYYNGHLWENEDRVALSNKIVGPDTTLPKTADLLDPKTYEPFQQKDYGPDFLVKAALNFIDKNKDKPFFLYYPTPLPHVSLQAPQRLVDYYHKKFGDEKPFRGGSYFPCRYPRATYAAMITLLDEQVGQIVQQLKKNGLYENTIIMFCSDNGPTYNGGVDPVYFNSAGPFNETFGWGKGFLREGGIRVPFIVQWPGKVQPGSTSDHISATIDMMPTFCELFNIKTPAKVDGISMLPEILGNNARQEKHDYLYFEFPQNGGQQAVRMSNWKAVRMELTKGTVKTELYDLSKDITEENDVATQHPEIVKKMEDIMKQEHQTPEVERFIIPVLGKKQAENGE